MKHLLLLLLASQVVFGELLVLGVKGGIPVTDAFETVSSGPLTLSSVTKRYTIGPTVELRLPFGLGAEADFLYKRTNVERSDSGPGEVTVERTAVNSWEFPLLAKYRMAGILARPYLSAGVSFRRLSELTGFLTGADRSTRGFVLAGGIELRTPLARLSPEVRYTRWKPEGAANGASLMRFNRNQAEFLLGITF